MTNKRILSLFVTFTAILSFVSPAVFPYREARAQDAIDPDQVIWHDHDVSGWPITTELSVSIREDQIVLNYDKANVWPEHEGGVGNAWFFARIGGQWHASTWEYMRPGQSTKFKTNLIDIPTAMHGDLKNFDVRAGETYGFMVSTYARSDIGVNGEERSDIVLATWTGNDVGVFGGGGDSPSGDEGDQTPGQPTPTIPTVPPPTPPDPNAPPVISGVYPPNVGPGDTVEIYGRNLFPGEVQLRGVQGTTGTYTVQGVSNQVATELRFEVTTSILPGNYQIVLVRPGGTVEATQNFTVIGPDEIMPPPIEIEIPTEGLPNFGDMIEGIFTWSLNLLGLAVFIMFFYAGFLRLTSAGNTGKIGQANNIMRNAAIGAVILLCSYVILRTINPDLTEGDIVLPVVPTEGEGGNYVCSHVGGYYSYRSVLSRAIGIVNAENPGGVADAPNTTEGSFAYLEAVAEVISSRLGVNATINVKNGHDAPNRGDLIAIWQEGDIVVERYDAVASTGSGDRPMRQAATAGQPVGRIPLSECLF